MSNDDDLPEDVVDTLVHRRDIVEQLVEESMDKRTLVDTTTASRSTISRALRELETLDLIHQVDGEYTVTPYGAFAYTQITDVLDSVAFGWDHRDILEHVPLEDLTFDLTALTGAEVTYATRTEPAAPLKRAVELKEQADYARTLAPGNSPGGTTAHYEAVTEHGQVFEAVCPPALIEAIASDPDQRDLFQKLLKLENASIYVYKDEITLPLGITDDTVFIGIENDQGSPIALFETTDQVVRRWAEIEFETCRNKATQLTPTAFQQDWLPASQ